jgi:LruC domain-containing protein
MYRLVILLSFSLYLVIVSCNRNDDNPENNPPQDIEELQIPDNFDFNTAREIILNIEDVEKGVVYDVYTLKNNSPDSVEYSDDTLVILDNLNNKIASALTGDNGEINLTLSIPAYHKYIYLMRNQNGKYYGTDVEVSNIINYVYNPVRFKSGRANDLLYAVNSGRKKLYSVDILTGTVSVVSNSLPYGSSANAVDPINNKVYIASNGKPYRLGYYDLNNDVFVVIGNLPFKAIKLDYNKYDGFLYISANNNHVYTIDPTGTQFLQDYTITGISNTSWGDLAFDKNGIIYLGTTSGIYRGEISGMEINCTKLNDNTLPEELTSLAVASDGMIYTYSNVIKNFIKFDPDTKVWTNIQLSPNIIINDFGIWRDESTVGEDTDGDGVPDSSDDYPDDPQRAFNNYFPGEGDWATLAYEDLWPSKGDYDFNDLVVGYNINQITDANNKVKEIKSVWAIRHNGAGLDNGFAFEMGVEPSTIESVTGFNLTSNYVELNGNGTEAGQSFANVVVIDETEPNIGDTIYIDIIFETPAVTSDLGVPPYNPYVIVGGDVTVEAHLPDMLPTSLANKNLFGTDDDDSNPAAGRYYKTKNNLPWGINIVYDFVWMKEKQEIILGYLKFSEWASSGGVLYPDWYKDLPGYRDDSYLDYQE